MGLRHYCIAGFLFAALSVAFAGETPSIQAQKTTTPPTIDGTIHADEWSQATTFHGLRDSETGATVDEGEFFLTSDDHYIYFAARLADPSPSSIRAVEYRTNVALSGDDNVSLQIEPTGATEAFSSFTMNAAGGSNLEIAGGRAIKREWLGEFVSKGRITETGWEVEARIPWKLMQLPSPGTRNAKFNIERYTTRTQRKSLWAFLGGAGVSYGLWNNVEIPKLPFERSLKLLPYGFIGSDPDDGTLTAVGMDLKTSVTPNIEAVATLNPDFRNIEGNILSLDFSYLERLPDDPRPFFQEGADYYGSLLFAPQRIGKFDTGFNVYGKLNDKLQFGALTTLDFGNESASIATATYQFDPRHLMRLSGSSLKGDRRPDNDSGLLRWVERFQDWGYGLRFAHTDDEAFGKGNAFDFDSGYQKGPLGVEFQYFDVDPSFVPRLGFVPERDYRGFSASASYNKPVATGPLMEWAIEGQALNFKHKSGDFYRSERVLATSTTFRDGTDIDFAYQKSGFEQFRDQIYYASIEKPRGDRYRRWQLDYTWGTVSNHDYSNILALISYRPLAKLQLALSSQTVRHFETQRQTILSANYDLGRDQSASGRLVERDGKLSGYVSWRKSGGRGTEYYVIVGDPNSARFRQSLVLKVVMPFELKL